jgi:hypothetical protein
MTPTSDPILNPDHRNRLTRRAPLAGTAAVAALVLSAGAALAAGDLSTGTDPHPAWWQAARRLRSEADAITRQMDAAHGRAVVELERQREPLWVEEWEIVGRIVSTPPTTVEGAAIVATALLWMVETSGEETRLDEITAGTTLATYFLAGLPADVLERAGLEPRS